RPPSNEPAPRADSVITRAVAATRPCNSDGVQVCRTLVVATLYEASAKPPTTLRRMSPTAAAAANSEMTDVRAKSRPMYALERMIVGPRPTAVRTLEASQEP